MSKFVYLVLLIISTIFSANCSDSNNKCVRENSCACRKNKYSKIDISSVLEKFEYLEDTSKFVTYFFFGCKDKQHTLNLPNCTTVNASLVRINATQNASCAEIAIGKAENINFELVGNSYEDYQIVYNQTNSATNSLPTIRLICDNFKTPFIKVINNATNELILSSPKVCMTTEHSGLSGGSIFVILFFVTAAVYFFGGILLLYCFRGARGVEAIPNLDFWKNLPGLVKDGVVFLLSGCRPTYVSTAETYDRI